MRVERLSGDLAEAGVEMRRVALQPGYGSGRDGFEYEGDELVLGEKGEVTFEIGEQKYLLRGGARARR